PAIAAIARPWSRQRIVEGRDLGVEHVRIALVRIDALLDDRLFVLMKRNAAVVVAVRALDGARLDEERVETAVAVSVVPMPDRIAGVAVLDLVRPGTPVGENPAQRAEDFE